MNPIELTDCLVEGCPQQAAETATNGRLCFRCFTIHVGPLMRHFEDLQRGNGAGRVLVAAARSSLIEAGVPSVEATRAIVDSCANLWQVDAEPLFLPPKDPDDVPDSPRVQRAVETAAAFIEGQGGIVNRQALVDFLSRVVPGAPVDRVLRRMRESDQAWAVQNGGTWFYTTDPTLTV